MQIYYRLLTIFLLSLAILAGCSKPDQPTIGLYLAIQRGDIDQIERHIAWETDINAMDVDGRRALHVAAGKGRYVIVDLLVESGAEIDAPDRDGHSPLHHAVLAGRTQVAELLVKQGAELHPDTLLDAVVSESIADRDIIPLLLNWGADINHKDSSGKTPLFHAISKGQRVVTKFLIANGADVNSKDNEGIRPLDLAEILEEKEISRLLRRNGAYPSSSDE